jgi:hypothetical protein
MDFNRIFKYGIVNIFWEELCENKLKSRTIVVKKLGIFIRLKPKNKNANKRGNPSVQFRQNLRKTGHSLRKLFPAELLNFVFYIMLVKKVFTIWTPACRSSPLWRRTSWFSFPRNRRSWNWVPPSRSRKTRRWGLRRWSGSW